MKSILVHLEDREAEKKSLLPEIPWKEILLFGLETLAKNQSRGKKESDSVAA